MRASTQENRPKIFIDDVTLIFNESWRFQRLEHSAKKQRNKFTQWSIFFSQFLITLTCLIIVQQILFFFGKKITYAALFKNYTFINF